MQSRFVRAAIVFVFAGAVSFLMPGEKAAAAIVEFCPARMDAAHVFGGSYDGLIAFYVAAESARSVSANVIAQGENGWYTFQFQNAAIVADLAHFRSRTVRFDRTLYHTKRMYVRFPAGERIVRWWIYDATSLGDTAFGWDQRGDYICLPQPDPYPNVKTTPLPDPPIRTNDSGDLLVPPGPSDTILASYKTAAPADIAKCDKAFVPATVVRAISPVYPRSVRGLAVSVTSEIEVAINANGSLAGAWVYTPSGIPDIDAAALRAAEI